jgi:hypothetical protein
MGLRLKEKEKCDYELGFGMLSRFLKGVNAIHLKEEGGERERDEERE